MISKHSLSLMKFITKRSLKNKFLKKNKRMAKKPQIKKSQIKMGEI
ncbi:hypothetical protein OUS_0408 [Helicobacter pylori R056a]|nr:hypothetical protein HPHPP28B_0137 [Helicobacter pylori Hp P-28b]EKE95847.1 hypothetical protein OUS_0408 [Helicobacter pylori R056a]